MKGDELELWIASLTTCNFITVQSNRWMLIVNKYLRNFYNPYYADAWEGPEGFTVLNLE